MNQIKAQYLTPRERDAHRKNIQERIEKNKHEKRMAEIQKRIDLYLLQRRVQEQSK